ncbi:unnamed protein product [Urochloa decumbens]|uniref:Knottins-like domain-containing protein n=1 Tax=Urochloa decumbens TaxID=240449 RepID=A0ABC9AW33_9POAL
MASSQKKLSAAAAASAAVLLLLVVAAEMVSIGEATCGHLSGDYHGPCVDDQSCRVICKHESSDNIDGACADTTPHCYCYTNC